MAYKRTLFAATIALGTLSTLATAYALPVSPASSSPASAPAQDSVKVQYRERGEAYDRRDADEDLMDVPGEVVSGAAEAVGDIGDNDQASGFAACARRFRSFDPSTGTYMTYSGERLTCPYLGE